MAFDSGISGAQLCRITRSDPFTQYPALGLGLCVLIWFVPPATHYLMRNDDTNVSSLDNT